MTTNFNAWKDPWIPVTSTDGSEQQSSLCELYLSAQNLRGLGTGLTPLALDSLMRFLVSIGAVILRHVPRDGWGSPGKPLDHFPASAVEAFGNEWERLFDLTGDHNGGRPFCQRWDRTLADLEALVTSKKPLESLILPLAQLHPHEPGGSSSEWSIRRDSRIHLDCPTITLLLVTAWFQTKNGNGRDPWGGKHLKGSANTWHTNPLALYFVDPSNLARTILANIPDAWIERDDVPVFLAHSPLPDDFAESMATSVTRFSYAKTLPLLIVEDEQPVGFVLGEDRTVPTPILAADEKASLGCVHERDTTRLYVTVRTKNRTDEKPRGSWGGQLTTTEGFERWFRADFGVSEAIHRWRSYQRVYTAPTGPSHWQLAVFSETTDGKGNRDWTDWSTTVLDFADARGEPLGQIRRLLVLASNCRRSMVAAFKVASQDGQVPPGATTAQAAYYTAIAPVIDELIAEHARGLTERVITGLAVEIRTAALRTFDAATAALATPANVRNVAQARRTYAAFTKKALHDDFPLLKEPTP